MAYPPTEYPKRIVEPIAAYFKQNDWEYEYREALGAFFAQAQTKQCNTVYLLVDVREDKYIVIAQCGALCGEETRGQLALLLADINHRLPFGSFDLDPSDGDLRFRLAVDCDGMDPSQAVIGRSLRYPVFAFGTFFEQIDLVMSGTCTAKEALRSAQTA